MVKLKDLDLKTVKPDGDGTVDCEQCKDPVGKFEELYILNDDTTYMICARCGTIYKVKD